MNASSDLFLLINSLSKSEKRHFKIFSSRHVSKRNNCSIKLFDIIEKQTRSRAPQYDEEKVVALTKGSALGKRLAVAKIYLYNSILKSLHAYHCNDSVDSQIKERLHYVKFLFDKALYGLCGKELNKIKKLVRQYEKYLPWIEVIEWEQKLTFINARNDLGMITEIESAVNEEREIVRKLLNYFSYRQIGARILSLPNKSDARKDKFILKKYNEVMQDASLSQVPEMNSYMENIQMLRALDIYHFRREEYPESLSYSLKAIELMEKYPEQISDNMNGYFAGLNNYVLTCRRARKYKDMGKGIKRMKQLIQTANQRRASKSFVMNVILTTTIFEFVLYSDTGEFEKGIDFFKSLKEETKIFESSSFVNYKLMYYYNIGSMYFGACRYKEAMYWFNKGLNDADIKKHDSIRRSLFFTNIVNHFEIHNYDLVENLAQSYTRAFLQDQNSGDYEVIILRFFQKEMLNFSDRRSAIRLFTSLKEELHRSPDYLSSIKNPMDFDFNSWLESKIRSIPFSEVIRERVRL
ncbi:MAG: hypothetical protein HYU69_15655 [Bacteroidetes bacterium]|nr:hypothetical protein [Bacteroidota bacterium]